jgi:hypothetical protein
MMMMGGYFYWMAVIFLLARRRLTYGAGARVFFSDIFSEKEFLTQHFSVRSSSVSLLLNMFMRGSKKQETLYVPLFCKCSHSCPSPLLQQPPFPPATGIDFHTRCCS